MDMMDTADQVRAHSTVHMAPCTRLHTAPQHTNCIVLHRAAPCRIMLYPILMDVMDTVDT